MAASCCCCITAAYCICCIIISCWRCIMAIAAGVYVPGTPVGLIIGRGAAMPGSATPATGDGPGAPTGAAGIAGSGTRYGVTAGAMVIGIAAMGTPGVPVVGPARRGPWMPTPGGLPPGAEATPVGSSSTPVWGRPPVAMMAAWGVMAAAGGADAVTTVCVCVLVAIGATDAVACCPIASRDLPAWPFTGCGCPTWLDLRPPFTDALRPVCDARRCRGSRGVQFSRVHRTTHAANPTEMAADITKMMMIAVVDEKIPSPNAAHARNASPELFTHTRKVTARIRSRTRMHAHAQHRSSNQNTLKLHSKPRIPGAGLLLNAARSIATDQRRCVCVRKCEMVAFMRAAALRLRTTDPGAKIQINVHVEQACVSQIIGDPRASHELHLSRF